MKALNVIAGIIGILALIGDIVFMYALNTLGQAISAFSQLDALTGGSEFTQAKETLLVALTAGWIWSGLVLLACIFVIKFAFLDPRKKK